MPGLLSCDNLDTYVTVDRCTAVVVGDRTEVGVLCTWLVVGALLCAGPADSVIWVATLGLSKGLQALGLVATVAVQLHDLTTRASYAGDDGLDDRIHVAMAAHLVDEIAQLLLGESR